MTNRGAAGYLPGGTANALPREARFGHPSDLLASVVASDRIVFGKNSGARVHRYFENFEERSLGLGGARRLAAIQPWPRKAGQAESFLLETALQG